MPTMNATVGVVGAGVMGAGVAQCLADRGHEVVLVDISDEVLDQARKVVLGNLRLARMLAPGDGDLEPHTVLERIAPTTDYAKLENATWIVENVTEDWPTKKDVYSTLDEVCAPECMFAANTSCISITQIASATNRADKVIGVHFMNPVFMKPAVEAIRGFHTSDETVSQCEQFLGSMGKECILVNDYPGFVSNRISHLFMNEACWVVQDGVADAATVDAIFKQCYGHQTGPLETADLIGLDTVLRSLHVLYDSYKDPKFRPSPLLVKMVNAGLCGRKSGEGFYKYS